MEEDLPSSHLKNIKVYLGSRRYKEAISTVQEFKCHYPGHESTKEIINLCAESSEKLASEGEYKLAFELCNLIRELESPSENDEFVTPDRNMYLGQILDRIKGIDKNTIYFYDKMGYINPRRVNVGKIEKRIYSERDFEMINAIWRYQGEGYTPRTAYKKAVIEMEENEENLNQKICELAKTAEEKEVTMEALISRGSISMKKDIMRILTELIEEK